MDERFQFTLDHSRRFLRITLHGTWTRDTVDRYRETVRKTVGAMTMEGYALEDVVILIDTRNLVVQSRDVADYYSAVPIYAAARPRKVATLAASRLVGIQIRRIGTGVQQIFDDEQDALEWLSSA